MESRVTKTLDQCFVMEQALPIAPHLKNIRVKSLTTVMYIVSKNASPKESSVTPAGVTIKLGVILGLLLLIAQLWGAIKLEEQIVYITQTA